MKKENSKKKKTTHEKKKKTTHEKKKYTGNDIYLKIKSGFSVIRSVAFDFLIIVAIIVCIGSIILAVDRFIQSRTEQSNAIEEYTRMIGNNTNQTNQDMKNILDNAIQLQEIEARSTQTDIISFIYTFISGTLIGVASFFIKKSADNTQKIEKQTSQIDKISKLSNAFENKAILSEFQTYLLLIESTTTKLLLLSINTATLPEELQSLRTEFGKNMYNYIEKVERLFFEYKWQLNSADKETKKEFCNRMEITIREIEKLERVPNSTRDAAIEWGGELENMRKKIYDTIRDEITGKQ